jgi:hypothetical protein
MRVDSARRGRRFVRALVTTNSVAVEATRFQAAHVQILASIFSSLDVEPGERASALEWMQVLESLDDRDGAPHTRLQALLREAQRRGLRSASPSPRSGSLPPPPAPLTRSMIALCSAGHEERERVAQRMEDSVPLRALENARRQPLVPGLPLSLLRLEHGSARGTVNRLLEERDGLAYLIGRGKLT